MQNHHTINGGKMKKLLLTTIVVAFFALGFQSISVKKNNGKMMRSERVLKELNFTDTQKEKFIWIRFAHQETKIDIEAQLKKNRLKVKKMMATDNIDEGKLVNIIDSGSELKANLMKSKVKMWLKIRSILDDEQKKIWTKHYNYMHERGKRFFDGDGHTKFRRGFK